MTKLVLFDWETTSNVPSTCRGVQLCALEFDVPEDPLAELTEFSTIINTIVNPGPGYESNYEAAKIHGITPEMCKGKVADNIAAQVLYDHLAALEEPVILVTHMGSTFDLTILWRLAAEGDPQGRPPLRLSHIDTYVCASRVLPNAPNHKLSVSTPEDIVKFKGPGLIQQLGLGTGEGAHDAEADVLMVAKLVRFFAVGLRGKVGAGNQPYEELAMWCAQARILTHAHFGKFKGRAWGLGKRDPKTGQRAKVNTKGEKLVPWHYVKNYVLDFWDSATPDMIVTMRHYYGRSFKFMRDRR